VSVRGLERRLEALEGEAAADQRDGAGDDRFLRAALEILLDGIISSTVVHVREDDVVMTGKEFLHLFFEVLELPESRAEDTSIFLEGFWGWMCDVLREHSHTFHGRSMDSKGNPVGGVALDKEKVKCFVEGILADGLPCLAKIPVV